MTPLRRDTDGGGSSEVQTPKAAKSLAVGMLLFEPRDEKHNFPGHVWCVKSIASKSARLVYAADACQVEGTIKQTTIPKGWREIRNAPLWKHLEEKEA